VYIPPGEKKLLLEIRRDEFGNFLLVEMMTGSIIRVVSGDEFLTRSFWTYFRA